MNSHINAAGCRLHCAGVRAAFQLLLASSAAAAARSSESSCLLMFFECCGVTNQTDITGPDTLWTRSHRGEFNGKLCRRCRSPACRMKATRSELLGKQDLEQCRRFTLGGPACPNTGNGVVTEKIRSEAGTTALKFRISSFLKPWTTGELNI
uniref:Secreted protein n=1 Tax=Macrostomum lignano TaxID=282301 RepID=A0A1I8FP25_9PLAT